MYRQLKSDGTIFQDAVSTIQFPVALVFCLLLMPFNLWLEALKWKILVRPLHEMTMWQSLVNILSGVFMGVFTPARVGEYGGRMINLPPDARIPSIAATLYGSIVQNSIHVLAGFGLSYYFIKSLIRETSENMLLLHIMSVGILLGLVIITLIPAYWQILFQKLTRYKFTKWIVRFDFLRQITTKTALSIIFLASLRYTVYFSQYMLILFALGIHIPFWQQSTGISLIYLIQSGLPLPPLLNILGRGEISVVVWQNFNVAVQLALSATFILWFINIVIPALVGYFMVLKYKSPSS